MFTETVHCQRMKRKQDWEIRRTISMSRQSSHSRRLRQSGSLEFGTLCRTPSEPFVLPGELYSEISQVAARGEESSRASFLRLIQSGFLSVVIGNQNIGKICESLHTILLKISNLKPDSSAGALCLSMSWPAGLSSSLCCLLIYLSQSVYLLSA